MAEDVKAQLKNDESMALLILASHSFLKILQLSNLPQSRVASVEAVRVCTIFVMPNSYVLNLKSQTEFANR